MQLEIWLQCLTRMKLSPAQQAGFTRAIIQESGCDTSKVSVSCATADRSRPTVNKDIAQAIQTSWIPPKFASLYWYSKLMVDKSKNKSEDRLEIAVGNNIDIKLLGVPSYQPGTEQRSYLMEQCSCRSRGNVWIQQ